MALNDGQITEFLNLCDRVEVLGELVHDSSHQLDEERFNQLMERYYPSLEQFYFDVKGEKEVVAVDVEIAEDSAVFTATHSDGSTSHFSYDLLDYFEE